MVYSSPLPVEALDHDALGPRHRRREARDAEAALFFELHAVALDELADSSSPCSAAGSLPSDRSITKIFSDMPTCGAARPMPGAAYIVSIMSSINVVDLRRDGVDRRASARSGSSPRAAGWDEARVRPGRAPGDATGGRGCASPVPVTRARRSIIESPPKRSSTASASTRRDHRFGHHRGRRHGADVAAFDGGRRLFERREIDGAERLHQASRSAS